MSFLKQKKPKNDEEKKIKNKSLSSSLIYQGKLRP